MDGAFYLMFSNYSVESENRYRSVKRGNTHDNKAKNYTNRNYGGGGGGQSYALLVKHGREQGVQNKNLEYLSQNKLKCRFRLEGNFCLISFISCFLGGLLMGYCYPFEFNYSAIFIYR